MKYRLLPEWDPHRGTWLTLPRRGGDWGCCWREVVEGFEQLVQSISRFEPVIAVVEPGEEKFWKKRFRGLEVEFKPAPSNDTWCRDYGGIPVEVEEEGKIKKGVLDFKFNGWGLKYPANWDNRLTRTLFGEEILESFNFVLEGGGIETNGKIVLTTRSSTLEENRNYPLSQREVETFFRQIFKVEEIVWVTGTPLLGDDTDGHIDTLARFITPTTLLYATTTPDNPNYPQLSQLELELKKGFEGRGIELIPIPLPSPLQWEGRYLPATYINFYLVNGGVIVPTYGDPMDQNVIQLFQKLLPEREVVPLDASIFIRQNGSIHCLTRDLH